jgi:hypothetical protein
VAARIVVGLVGLETGAKKKSRVSMFLDRNLETKYVGTVEKNSAQAEPNGSSGKQRNRRRKVR